MIDRNGLKRYIVEIHERDFKDVKPRELTIKTVKGKANVIIGPRRAGKTYYLFHLMREGGREREDYLYLDFEHPLFYALTPKDFPKILDMYEELYPGRKPILLLDEVQAVPDWERMVRYSLDIGSTVYVTGSSSRLLSQEIASHLRGRGLTYTLMPLSFREYLDFRGIKYRGRDAYGNYPLIVRSLEEYLRYGSYPEIALVEDEGVKLRILKEYLDLVVRRDVLERYRPRNRRLINELIYFSLNSYSRYLSFDSLYRLFKRRGKLTKRTLINYVRYLEESFAIFLLERYSPSVKERIVAPRKLYLVDTGYGNFGAKDISRDMENAVFLELFRWTSAHPLRRIYYWRSRTDHEVDFVLVEKGKIAELLQVSFSLSGERTKSREVRSLLKASRVLGCKKLEIITWEEEGEEELEWWGNRGKVRFIPLWKWLLKIG